MAASDASALDAIAFQLAAALERYEQDVGTMVDTWLDMDLYQQVSNEIEDIRRLSVALPELSVPWVELLIAHAELVHSLWRLRFKDGDADRTRVRELREWHTGCVNSLRTRCVRLLSRSERSDA